MCPSVQVEIESVAPSEGRLRLGASGATRAVPALWPPTGPRLRSQGVSLGGGDATSRVSWGDFERTQFRHDGQQSLTR